MNADAAFGPVMQEPTIKSFAEISAEAFRIYNEALRGADRNDPLVYLYSRFGFLSESVSWSIRSLVSWNRVLPAMPLARVRLEQIIITSYLIFEDVEIALKPYLRQFPIDQFRNTREAMSNATLRPHLSDEVHAQVTAAAQAARKQMDPTFAGPPESIATKKWTNLDLLSMARRRDQLTTTLRNASRFPLENSYTAFYRDFSALVHTSSMAVSPEFLVDVRLPDGRIVTVQDPVWNRNLVMVLSTWDILHVFELLRAMELDREEKLKELNSRWVEQRDLVFRPSPGPEKSAASGA